MTDRLTPVRSLHYSFVFSRSEISRWTRVISPRGIGREPPQHLRQTPALLPMGIAFKGTAAAALAATALFLASAHKPLPQGLVLHSLAGEAWTLDERRGKSLVINLWANWCRSCLSTRARTRYGYVPGFTDRRLHRPMSFWTRISARAPRSDRRASLRRCSSTATASSAWRM